jgi:hypothetical protein
MKTILITMLVTLSNLAYADQTPLSEMSDTGYDNSGEEFGYMMHEWETNNKGIQGQLETKANNSEFQSLSNYLEAYIRNAPTKKEYMDLIKQIEEIQGDNKAVNILAEKIDSFTQAFKVAKATFDYTNQPLTGTFQTTIGLPEGAIVMSAWYEVTDTFTSDDTTPDDTEIKLSLESDGDIKASTKILDGSNSWDSGFHDTLATKSTDADNIKMTTVRAVDIEVTNGAGVTNGLTAGSLTIYIEYLSI